MNIKRHHSNPGRQIAKGDKPTPKPNLEPAGAEPVVDSVQGGRTEKNSRLIGKIGKFIAKLPKAAKHFPGFLKAALVGTLGVGLKIAAGGLGLAGMAGLGLAGGLEIREGIKEKDKLKILGGAGEVVRGGFTGAASLGHIFDLGQHAGTVAKVAGVLGLVQGGIHITSGALKFTEGRSENVRSRKIEGLLEMGMGAASLVMVTGAMTPVAVGAYTALTTARFLLVNKDGIKKGICKAKETTQKFWHDIKSEFKDEDAPENPPPANPPPK